MDSYKSEKTVVNAPVERVFAKLSNPQLFISSLGELPEEAKEKLQSVTFGEDSVTFEVQPVGKITMKVKEKAENSKVVLGPEVSPIPFEAVINMEKVDEGRTALEAELRMELNPFMRAMVGSHLEKGAKKFGDLFAMFPF